MKISTLNELKEAQFVTVFEIPKDRQIVVTSREKLKVRDIRIIQLSLMLNDDEDTKRISYNTLKQNLNLLTALEDSEMSYLIRYFKILDFEKEEFVSVLDEKALDIFERNTNNRINRFLIQRTYQENEIKKMSIRTLTGLKYYLILQKNNIITIGDLIEYSPKELLNIQGIGEETVKRIQKKLKMIKLSLKEDSEEEKKP